MRYLLITLLMFTAPLSWGEDVWYCVDNKWAGLDYKSSEQKWVQNNITPSGFALKYDGNNDTVALQGDGWTASTAPAITLGCYTCNVVDTPIIDGPHLVAAGDGIAFTLRDDTFHAAFVGPYRKGVWMRAGTCTKF